MKNTFLSLGMVTFVATLLIITLKATSLYSLEGEVKANYNGWVLVEDTHGNLWEFDDDEVQIGDQVKLYMSDNGTVETIEDDEIVNYIIER